jgi:gluconate kinase
LVLHNLLLDGGEDDGWLEIEEEVVESEETSEHRLAMLSSLKRAGKDLRDRLREENTWRTIL